MYLKMKSSSFKDRFGSLKLAVRWTYKSSKSLTILVFVVTILGALLTIIEPYVFKVIIDRLVGSSDISLATKLGLGLIGVLVVYGIARVTQSILWDTQMVIRKVHSQMLDRYVTHTLMDKISSLDAVYFENPEYYNTLQKANQNLWRVNEFFWQFSFFLGQFISILVIISALTTLNFLVVALIAFAAIPSVLLTFRRAKVTWGVFDASSPIFREAVYYKTLMTERPDAIKEIKLFGLKPHFLSKFEDLFSDFIAKQKKAAFKEVIQFIFISCIEGFFSVLAAFIVIRAFIDGKISIGGLTFYWALLFQFAEHARYLVRILGELNENAIFITPFVKVLNFRSTIKEPSNPKKFPVKLSEGIEFRNVTFSYPRSKTPVLKNFNMVIKPGESIALVGENGSGKTTVVKLLTRLYDVSSGEILIDGVNIKKYPTKSLYDNLGVIFQDFFKYEGLVEENIGYGKVSELSKKSKIHEASLKAEAWNFIKGLEKGYKTHVGKTLKDEGIELSVGQWQKIALARAFFKDAQILCLDEPTAAVDAKAEYRLFQKFKSLTKNKTTILISHRFSTVRMADKIIVMDKGRIVEEGTHQDLLGKEGYYASLFKLQAEGYEDYFNANSRKRYSTR